MLLRNNERAIVVFMVLFNMLLKLMVPRSRFLKDRKLQQLCYDLNNELVTCTAVTKPIEPHGSVG